MNLILKIFIIYYISINIILFIMMGMDKSFAKKNKRRISEANLFLMSFLGGSLGGFMGMKFFHHKTKKSSFYAIYSVSFIIHCIILYFVFKNFITI